MAGITLSGVNQKQGVYSPENGYDLSAAKIKRITTTTVPLTKKPVVGNHGTNLEKTSKMPEPANLEQTKKNVASDLANGTLVHNKGGKFVKEGLYFDSDAFAKNNNGKILTGSQLRERYSGVLGSGDIAEANPDWHATGQSMDGFGSRQTLDTEPVTGKTKLPFANFTNNGISLEKEKK